MRNNELARLNIGFFINLSHRNEDDMENLYQIMYEYLLGADIRTANSICVR